MERNSEDKAERVLTIYSKLKQGKVVYRESMSEIFGVSERTIQRDITDIQNFLQNQIVETGSIQEIVHDKRAGGYRLQIKQTNELNGKAVLTVCKILLQSRALTKAEMLQIVYSLIRLCDNDAETVDVKELLHNEIQCYIELRHGQKLLERLWDLEKAVKAHQYIEMRYKNLQNSGEVIQKIKPVGIVFSRFYFYLVAYLADTEREEIIHHDDTFPVFYRVDRIQEYTVEKENFQPPYAGQFDENEFRKRIPFMQAGDLEKVEFLYVGRTLESVLDRLPAAVVKKSNREGYVVEVEVFGRGIETWLESQGENVQNIQKIV